MLFKPNTLIYIQRGGLLVAGRHLTSFRLTFTDDVVRNMEVLQPAKFTEQCQKLLTDNELHGKRIEIVLDFSVVFEKTIELDQSGKPDIIMQGFVAAMPFDVGKRACLAVQNGPSLRLFATNAELYQGVVEAVRRANAGTLTGITPIAAYDLSDNERTIRTATDHILKNSDVSHNVNFRDITPE